MKFFNSYKLIVLFLILTCVFSLRIKYTEGELLDAEYYQIIRMQKRGELTLFELPDDASDSKEKT